MGSSDSPDAPASTADSGYLPESASDAPNAMDERRQPSPSRIPGARAASADELAPSKTPEESPDPSQDFRGQGEGLFSEEATTDWKGDAPSPSNVASGHALGLSAVVLPTQTGAILSLAKEIARGAAAVGEAFYGIFTKDRSPDPLDHIDPNLHEAFAEAYKNSSRFREIVERLLEWRGRFEVRIEPVPNQLATNYPDMEGRDIHDDPLRLEALPVVAIDPDLAFSQDPGSEFGSP